MEPPQSTNEKPAQAERFCFKKTLQVGGDRGVHSDEEIARFDGNQRTIVANSEVAVIGSILVI